MNRSVPINVLLLEDEKPSREHFSNTIHAHSDLQLLDSCETCMDAINALKTKKPDIFVSDLGLPDGKGVQVIREAKSLYPDIEILVVTMYGDEENVVEALEAGASGYLLKKQALETLGESILSLINGESPISPEIARYLLKRFKKEMPKPESPINNPLTAKEIEVLTLIGKGYTYDEIAGILESSINTIRTHIRNIYKKLSVNSRSEAVFEANQQGFINLS